MNWYVLFISAAIPLVTGYIWYNPKVFGTAWMKASGFVPDPSKAGNMLGIFALTYLFGLFISSQLMSIVVHQMGVFSIFSEIPNSQEPGSEFMVFMEKYGKLYRTFKHGALHGFISGLFYVLPIMGVITLFERRGAKYLFVHAGYWILTLMLMGGLICQML